MLLSQWFFYNKPQLWKIASPDCWTSTPNCKGSQLKLLIEQLLNAQMLNELNTNCWKKKKISAKLYHPAVHTNMYNVHCTLCTMYCTYSVQCTVYNDSITTNNYVDLQQQCYWLTSVPRAQPPNPKSTTIKVQEHIHPSPKAQPSKSKSTTTQFQ